MNQTGLRSPPSISMAKLELCVVHQMDDLDDDSFEWNLRWRCGSRTVARSARRTEGGVLMGVGGART